MSKSIEQQKLLRVLNATEKELAFIDKLNEAEIENLRLKTSEQIELNQSELWERFAKVAKFMPNFVNAKVAETILGAMITANLSYYIPVKDAVAVLQYLSINFLVEVTEHIIPEKCPALINAISIKILSKVTKQLIAQKKFFTAAAFVDVCDLDKIMILSNDIHREEDLIAISKFVENKKAIAKIVERFDNKRLEKIILKAYEINEQEELFIVFVELNSNAIQKVLFVIQQMHSDNQTMILKDFESRIQR
ncbi:MAG: hypothetical protein H6553_12450 [Chitinophagales bacterium]|nr:hypothetical protein [Chitinophagales bacterium]